jgi:hypothetical protein
MPSDHPQYEAIIDCTLAGAGHYIPCKAGSVYHVPKALVSQALSFGMKLAKGQAPPLETNNEPDPKAGYPETIEDREDRIKQGIRDLIVENDPSKFAGGTGRPNAVQLSKHVGFQVFVTEVNKRWPKIKEELSRDTR